MIKSTGIVRKVDELGRIVLPKELRRVLEIKERDPMEILVEDEKIILRKYYRNKACIYTGEESDQNMTLSGGIVLSREGAKILLDEIAALED